MTAVTMWGLEIQTRDHHLHELYFNSGLARERFLRDFRPGLAGHRMIGAEDRQQTASDILSDVRDQLRRDLDEETTAAARIPELRGNGPAARRDRQWALERAEIIDGVLTMLDQAGHRAAGEVTFGFCRECHATIASAGHLARGLCPGCQALDESGDL